MKKFSDSTKKEKSTKTSNRRDFLKKASVGGLGVGLLGTTASAAIVSIAVMPGWEP